MYADQIVNGWHQSWSDDSIRKFEYRSRLQGKIAKDASKTQTIRSELIDPDKERRWNNKFEKRSSKTQPMST